MLALVLAISGFAKARHRAETHASIVGLGVSATLAPTFRWALPVTELLVAIILIAPATRLAGAIAAVALFGVFTVIIAGNLMAGRRPPCGCFGERGGAAISAWTLARNVTFMALAILAIP